MYVEMDNGNNSYMAHSLIISAHVSLQSPLCGLLYRAFCVLGNDFSGLWSQLRSGLYSGYVLCLNFLGESKQSQLASGLCSRVFTCTGLTVFELELTR